MTIQEIVKMFTDNGVTIAILIYFCVRDWKFMTTLTEVLASLKAQTERLSDIIEERTTE